MDKLNFLDKITGDTLEALEWNSVVSKIDELVEASNTGGGTPASIDPSGVISVNSKGNTTISAAKHINIEPLYDTTGSEQGAYGDVQIKPGDDITLESHHRAASKRDEITIKTSNGKSGAEKAPVKLQVIASDITLSSKGKLGNDSNVTNVNVTTGSGKGYLKVRAQAIDLRCEEHGGIALQPKGTDSSGHMNKIKFEHGGGDGLEFGTFNAEKTSIYTDEYRFKKDGVWKMATRTLVVSDKADENDPTTLYKYVKASDDFYDNISEEDEQCTTNDLIKTAHAFNNSKNRHAKYEEKVTNKGELKKTLEVETVVTISYSVTEDSATSQIIIPEAIADVNKVYTISDFKDAIKLVTVEGVILKYGIRGEEGITLSAGDIVTIEGSNYAIVENFAPSMEITSGAELSLKGSLKLNLKGDSVEFGSDIIDLGEMEDGLYAQYKLTKKNNSKPCDTIKIKVINNGTSELSFDADSLNFAIESFYPGSDENHPVAVTVPGKIAEPTTEEEANQHIKVVAQCKLFDIVKFVAWAKANNFGPWAV